VKETFPASHPIHSSLGLAHTLWAVPCLHLLLLLPLAQVHLCILAKNVVLITKEIFIADGNRYNKYNIFIQKCIAYTHLNLLLFITHSISKSAMTEPYYIFRYSVSIQMCKYFFKELITNNFFKDPANKSNHTFQLQKMHVNELSYSSIHIQTNRQKVAGEWRELNTEQLMISAPNIVWLIKQRKKRSVSHVVCTCGKRNSCSILGGKSEERENLKKETTWMADTYMRGQ
jgi:hypothetical protein